MSGVVSLASIHVQGTNYTGFTTGKSMLGSTTATEASAAISPIWPRALMRGSLIRIRFKASISSVSGNTMIIQVMLGSTAIFTSDTLKVSTTTGVLQSAHGEIDLVCQSTGTGTLAKTMGNGIIVGKMIYPPGSTPGADYAAGGGSSILLATAAQGTGFDSTIQNTLDFNVTMGTNAAGNGWRMDQFDVDLAGPLGP